MEVSWVRESGKKKKKKKIHLVWISYGLIPLGAATCIQGNRKVTSGFPPSSDYASVPQIMVVRTQLLENLYSLFGVI